VRSVELDSKPRESGVNRGERLTLRYVGKAVRGQAMTANRTRENRLSGMIGGLAETWARVKAIRAHNAETPKQTSLHLRLRALHFYPDGAADKAADLEGWKSPYRQLPETDG
jgi:hypothetical protein